MYRQGIPEKAIQSRTGHKSIEALHTYERVSPDQERSICNVLANATNQQLPAGQAVCSTVMMPQNTAFNISGCTVNIYNAPVSIGESSVMNENHLPVKDLEHFSDFRAF